MRSRTGRWLFHLIAALFVLGAVSACGGSSPSTAMAPTEPESTVGPEDDNEAAPPVSEYRPWTEDEVHATFIPSGPGEDGTHHAFPPGVRYALYRYVDTVNDQAPVIAFGPALHVGADIAPPAGALRGTGSRGGVVLSEGEVRDGVGAAEVLEYLRTVAGGEIEDIAGLQKWDTQPYVRVVGTETDGRYIRLTQDAVRIVNAALPFTRRLRLQAVDSPITEERAESVYDLPIRVQGHIRAVPSQVGSLVVGRRGRRARQGTGVEAGLLQRAEAAT